ncbi:MAG: thiamine-phosphate synthase family protein [Candidatus Thorarchaeota archaeon]
MKPPCEIVQRDFLRVVRIFVARSLKDEGFSQTEIASKMNMTQAAISKYLSEPVIKSKLGNEIGFLTEKLTELMRTSDYTEDQIVQEICSTCMRSRIGSTLCEMHQKSVPSLKDANCQVCSKLLGGRDDSLAERAIVISDILDALRIIEQSRTFPSIVPQVRANFVACNEQAKSVKEVVGVPGRITVVDGYARALVSPQFGASTHTAELLLHARKDWNRVRACLCVSGRSEVIHAARKSGFKVVSIPDPESLTSRIIKSLKTAPELPSKGTIYPAIHVPGGIGVEPILYLFGPSAKELSERSLKLSDYLVP